MIQLISLQTQDGPRSGLLHNGKAYPSPRYASTQDALNDWAQVVPRLEGLAATISERPGIEQPSLLAPLMMPRNIYFAGANYTDHVEEMKRELGMPLDADPKASGLAPWFSIKATGSSVVGPGAVVQRPQNCPMLDWELELAVVIGTTAKDVSIADALKYVAGYTVVNDLSARDHVSRPSVPTASPFRWDWIGQKSFDGSCPMGPAITPAVFAGDAQNLDLKLWVNDELMQSSNTNQMIFSIAEQISHLSSRITLHPGDVILTGTPAGVGMAQNRFLKAGDVVRQWIQNIGEFSFTIA